ncbi:MAG: hypothetical protein FJX77_00990 [Armatimonadetes bacterium]|nr:hypothetical protein [Armatimonadota bacterium]
MDCNDDGTLSREEQQRHATWLSRSQLLEIGGRTVAWKLAEYQFPTRDEFVTGGFPVVTVKLTAPLPDLPPGGVECRNQDRTYPEHVGLFPRPAVRPLRLTASSPTISDNGREVRFRVYPPGGVLPPGIPAGPASGARTGQELSRDQGSGANPFSAFLAQATPGELRGWFQERQLDAKQIMAGGRGRILYGASGADRTLGGAARSPLAVVLSGAALFCLGLCLGSRPTARQDSAQSRAVWRRVLVPVLEEAAGATLLAAVLLIIAPRLEAEAVRLALSLFGALGVVALALWLFLQGLRPSGPPIGAGEAVTAAALAGLALGDGLVGALLVLLSLTGTLLGRLGSTGGVRFSWLAPSVGAAGLFFWGLWMTLQALAQGGWIRLG